MLTSTYIYSVRSPCIAALGPANASENTIWCFSMVFLEQCLCLSFTPPAACLRGSLQNQPKRSGECATAKHNAARGKKLHTSRHMSQVSASHVCMHIIFEFLKLATDTIACMALLAGTLHRVACCGAAGGLLDAATRFNIDDTDNSNASIRIVTAL